MRYPEEQARHSSTAAHSEGKPSTSCGQVRRAQYGATARIRFLVLGGTVVGLAAVGIAGWATFDFWQAAWATIGMRSASQAAFRAWIGEFGVWAPAIYLLVVAAQVIAAPIPASVFPAVGAAAFGPAAALALTMGGMLAGSAGVFALARRWGRPLVERLVGREPLDKYAPSSRPGAGYGSS